MLDSDPIQIGPELTNDLLDYAQHLALIKEGGPQIAGNKGLLDQFMTLTGTTLAMKWASDPQEIAATDPDHAGRRDGAVPQWLISHDLPNGSSTRDLVLPA